MTDLILFNSANINIPTKKLNSLQLKQYQEYAMSLVETIQKYIREIKETKSSEFEKINREVIKDGLVKKLGVQSIADKLNKQITILVEHSKLVGARREKYEKETEELAIKYNADLIELKVVANKLFDSSKKVLEDINTQLEKKELDKLSSRYFTLSGGGTFNISEISYGNYVNDESHIRQSAENLLNSSMIEKELRVRMEPVLKEWKEKEQAIKDLKVTVKEILMFDETKINQAFQQLISFRNAVKAEWQKVCEK